MTANTSQSTMFRTVQWLIFICLLVPPPGKGQELKNGDFENWRSVTHYQKPQNWFTNNNTFIDNDFPPLVNRSPDAKNGNYALKVTSSASIRRTGRATLFNPYTSTLLDSGITYRQRPDSITGYAKYDIKAGDTARIRLAFLQNVANGGNNLLGSVIVKIYGSADKYEFFSIPINWRTPINEKPDTLSAVIEASQNENYNNELFVDQLRFKKGNSFLPLPNGNFENWEPINSSEPSHWHSLNTMSLATSSRVMKKTNNAYKGQYAALVKNILTYRDFKIGVVEKQKELNPPHSYPDSVKGVYRYSPKGKDSAWIGYSLVDYIRSIDSSVTLMGQLKKLEPTDQYKPLHLNIPYTGNQKPDSLYILFSSGHINSDYPGNLESKLYIDDLSMSFKENTAIEQTPNESISVYPNPVKNQLKIEGLKQTRQFRLFDRQGDLLKGVTIKCDNKSGARPYCIDLSQFSPGIYFYRIGGVKSGKVIISNKKWE